MKGQSVVLDTFFLTADEADDALIEKGIYGECHIVCLEKSEEGRLWGRRIYTNMSEARRFPTVFEGEGLAVLRNANLAESVIISERGWYMYVRDAELADRIEGPEGWLVAAATELSSELDEEAGKVFSDSSLETLARQGAHRQGMPLASLYAELGLVEFVNHPKTLEGGTFTFERRPGSDGDPDIIILRMRHRYLIPSAATAAIGAAAGVA
jgi:hypothetical protein